MTDTAYSPDHDPTAHYWAVDDEPIVYVSHHRELIRRAGRLARAEQAALERQLQDSKAPGLD